MTKVKLIFFAVFITVFVSIPIIGMMGGIGKEYSDGVRAGHLIKTSKKGLLFKSFEGELQRRDTF